MDKKILVSLITALLIFISCSKESKEEPQVTKSDEVLQLEESLNSDPQNLDIVKELLDSYYDSELKPDYIDLYENHEDSLTDSYIHRLHHATSQCMSAGETDDIMKQLSYVKKGMASFEIAVEDFPDEKMVYIYRAANYSNFPSIMGVKETVISDLETLQSGKWELTERDYHNIYYAYLHLSLNYEDSDLFNSSFSNLKRDLTDTSQEIYELYSTHQESFN